MITAGVYRAYNTWIADTIHGKPTPNQDEKLAATKQVVSEQLVGRSANSVRVGVIQFALGFFLCAVSHRCLASMHSSLGSVPCALRWLVVPCRSLSLAARSQYCCLSWKSASGGVLALHFYFMIFLLLLFICYFFLFFSFLKDLWNFLLPLFLWILLIYYKGEHHVNCSNFHIYALLFYVQIQQTGR